MLTGQLAHAAVDLGLEARLTVSAIPQSQQRGEASKKNSTHFCLASETNSESAGHPRAEIGKNWRDPRVFPISTRNSTMTCNIDQRNQAKRAHKARLITLKDIKNNHTQINRLINLIAQRLQTFPKRKHQQIKLIKILIPIYKDLEHNRRVKYIHAGNAKGMNSFR